MVFVEPSKSFNVQGLWLDEKRNRFFLLQRHRAAQTALGSSLQLMRNVLGPASGADGYRIICSSSPYYQVASAFDQQEILQDWAWIEEHLMPLAEKMEGRDFRILVVKYFSDLAHGKPIHLPRIGSVHIDLHRLADRQGEEGRRDLPDEEEIAVLGANNPEEDDAVDVVDLDDLGTSKGDDKWIGKIIGNESGDSPSPLRKEQRDDTETLSTSNGTTTTSDSSSEQQSDAASGSGADHDLAEPGVQWPGLRFLPEQYAHPEKAFGWLRSMARGTDFDGWRYLEEEAGVSFYRKQVEGPNGKRDMYKGVVVIDATAKNIFQMLNQVDKWPKWDRTLSQAQVLDRVDKKNEIVHLRFKKFFPAFSSLAQAVNMSKRAEKERDMVVFKSWGTHERDSYAIYFRSVEYDKLAPDADVIRMDTEGCGFIIEPMSSIFSAASFRSPLGEPSGLATASIVTFVSDINWKGWLTPIMGEYVHFTKVMLLKEVRNSFMPDLAFMGRKSATISDADDDEPQEAQQQHQQYSFQSAMKGFSSFIEQKKQRIMEERERRRHEGSNAAEDGGETDAETEGEGEIGMLDRLKAMFDTGKAAPNDLEVADDAETAKTTDKGMWGQWKQALTFKNAKTATSDDGAQAPPAEDLRDAAAATSPEPTPTEGNKGWLGMMKGALAPKTANGTATTPAAAAAAPTEPATSEPAKKGTGGGWFDRMKGATTASSAAPAEQTNNGGSAWAGGSSWLNRMKESVATATTTTTKKAPDGEQPTTEKGWLERVKEAVKVKDTGAPPPAGNGAPPPAGNGAVELKTFTLKFTAVEDVDEPEGIKGKEAEHDKEEVLEEVTKQQNDSSAGLAHDDLTLL